MADEQQLTQEEITTLLTNLFVNENNLDKTYYDMFYNPIPMDIEIQRYDENNVLQTYLIPNRAKDRQESSFILQGEVAPEDNVMASIGNMYLNILTSELYYKTEGSSTSSSGWKLIYTQGANSTNPLPVTYGGTGVNSIIGLVKGRGTDSFIRATEYMNYNTPDTLPTYDTDILNGNFNADYISAMSATKYADKKVLNEANARAQAISAHNSSSSAHQALFNAKQNKLTAGTNIRISGNVISCTYSAPTSGMSFPDYSSFTDVGLNSSYTTTSNGFLMSYVVTKQGALGTTLTVKIRIGSDTFPIDYFFTESGNVSSFSFIPIGSGISCEVIASSTRAGINENSSYVYFIPCL